MADRSVLKAVAKLGARTEPPETCIEWYLAEYHAALQKTLQAPAGQDLHGLTPEEWKEARAAAQVAEKRQDLEGYISYAFERSHEQTIAEAEAAIAKDQAKIAAHRAALESETAREQRLDLSCQIGAALLRCEDHHRLIATTKGQIEACRKIRAELLQWLRPDDWTRGAWSQAVQGIQTKMNQAAAWSSGKAPAPIVLAGDEIPVFARLNEVYLASRGLLRESATTSSRPAKAAPAAKPPAQPSAPEQLERLLGGQKASRDELQALQALARTLPQAKAWAQLLRPSAAACAQKQDAIYRSLTGESSSGGSRGRVYAPRHRSSRRRLGW